MLTLQLLTLLLLMLVNGFFSMAEIALVSARQARLQPLAAGGSAGAEAALELKSDPSRLLATVQIGITIIAVLSGTFGQATLGERLQAYLEAQGGALAGYAHALAIAAVVIGISYFSLILGELVPKRIALSHPEGIAARLARIMRWLARLTTPLEWLLTQRPT
jgi:putative hemolysin